MEAEINELIAKRVEERRTRLGMTLPELARATGLPSSTLERLELQYGGCSAADLWRVARVLDVPVTELCPSGPKARLSGSGLAVDDQDPPLRSWRERLNLRPSDKGRPRGMN